MIDLSLLSPPDVVEPLDFETILAALKQRAIELKPDIADTLDFESEPVTVLLQVVAYRELQLRQRINEAARSVMLAYAAGTNLDQIGGNYGLERLVIDAGDAEAVPPIAPTYESDADFRRRILLSLEGYTTAGSQESYVFHALSAAGDVLDASAVSTVPGQVTVYVLSRTGDGTASDVLLATVADALNAERVRPITDQVTVLSASIVTYAIDATLVVSNGPDSETLRLAAINAAREYVDSHHRLGMGVSLSGIYRALHQPGVLRVDLAEPAANVAVSAGQAAYCTGITVMAGDGGA